MQQTLGFGHFLAQADGVGRTVLALMLLMSAIGWYWIVLKAWALWRERRASDAFMAALPDSPTLAALRQAATSAPAQGSLARMTLRMLALPAVASAPPASDADSQTARTLRRAIAREAGAQEVGMTWLASIGSTAPFVGLFGTVWGVYQALIAIGISGQGSLDKVAGPVGEALIMTALGLAVAVPAVLAYNAFARANRVTVAQMEGLAHDLMAVRGE
jgi:biopolymer transport protein ExbB